jgi:predicted phage tail protein
MEDFQDLPEVSGAGGGGGGQQVVQQTVQQNVTIAAPTARQPTVAANNLFSVAFAKTVYALSEGEIEGFPNSITKDTFLDSTPIQNEDDTYNYQGYTIEHRTGTDETQTPIEGFSTTENVVGVNTNLTVTAGALTRTITDTDVERCRIIMTFPALQAQNRDNGDITSTSVQFRIEVSANGGAYTTVDSPTVSGKSNSQFQRAYEFDLDGTGPWTIRLTRLTGDDSSGYVANQTRWQSLVEIIDEKFAYPNTALLALKVDSRQFNSIPNVSVRLRGKRVQVPSNYNAETRTYTGIWDGTFQMAWTDNPAWIFRDIVVNDRFGVARYVPNISIDPWYLYTVSQYCDESVPNGNGGTEPRFTCNVYLQNAGSVYEVLNGLASCFRGLIYYSQGQLFLTQDRAQLPVQQFSEANVIQEVDDSGQVTSPCFTYTGTARGARKSVVLANWDDPNQAYSSVTEYQQDDALLETFGYNPIDLRLLGVTSRGQALRAAKHTLFSNRYLTEKVSFRIGAEGLAAGVGEIIQIADPLKQGQRLGGRIKEISGNNIKLDAVLNLNDAIDYTLTLVVPDGETVTNPDNTITKRPKLSVHNLISATEDESEAELRSLATQGGIDVLVTQDGDEIEGQTIVDKLGTTTAVVDGNVDSQVNALWVLEWSDMQAALYKIVAITEVDPLVFQVEAIQYNASKFDYVDNDLPIAIPKDRFTLQATQAVVSLTAKLAYNNGRTQINANWQAPERNGADDVLIRGYRYQWRQTGAAQWNEVEVTSVTNATISLPDHVYGTGYEFRAATFDRLSRQSEFTVVTVANFDAIPDLSAAEFNATVTHANQPDGTQLIIVDPGTCPILPRITGFRCWARPRNLKGGEIPGVKTPGNDGYYFLADIPLTGYYTIAFHAPDTYDIRISFTSAVFGEEPDDYIYDVVERAEIAPPTPNNFSVVESANRAGKRFSWQLPLSEYGSWDQKVVSDIVGYEVRFKRGTLATNIVEFDVATDIVTVKTSTVIGIKTNQHLLTVGQEIIFAASAGTLPTGITAGTTYFVAEEGFNSVEFKLAATAGGAPINLTGTATGTYNVSGPAALATRLNLSASWGAGIELASGGLNANQQWFETSLFDADTWVVMVKSVDATNWRSDLPAFVLVNIGAPPISNAVATINARTQGAGSWEGNYINCEVDGDGDLVQTDATRDSIFTWNFDNNEAESNLLLSTTATATYQHKLVALTGEDLVLVQDPDGTNDDDKLLQEDTPVVITVASSSFQLQRGGSTIPHLLEVNDTLEFVEVAGSLPTGISTGTTYHVVSTDLTTTVFRVAATQGGTAITLSGTATGTYAVRGAAFGILGEQRFYSDTELAEGGIVHPYAPYERLLGDVYRVQTTFKSPDGVVAGEITALTAQLDYPDVIEKQNDVAISSAGTAVSLSKTFRSVESVQITALQTGGSTAITAVVTAKTTTSVTIKCLDASGSGVTGLVDITVIGY